jgi:hypothetical protein
MATWFWAATAPANFATNNWATTSGGSPTGQPASGDIAIFDSTSSETCTIAAAVTLGALDCQGGTGNFAGTLVQDAVVVTINAAGNGFRLAPGMTFTPPVALNSTTTFTNTSGQANLTSAGHQIGAVTVNGVGGTVQQQDNLMCGSFTLDAGTWDSNNAEGFTLTCSSFTITGTAVREFIGAGTITIGQGGNFSGGTGVFSASNTTGLTFTLNSANIIIGPSGSAPAAATGCNFGNLTFNDITFQNNTLSVVLNVTGNMTCDTLTIGSGWGWSLPNAGVYTIMGAGGLTINGTETDPVFLMGSGITAAAVFNCTSGTCNISWGVFGNAIANGGATFVSTNSLSVGNATGWGITLPSIITPGSVATAVWQDLLTSSDFTTAGSIGALLAAVKNLQFTVQAIGRGTVGSSSTTTSVTTSAFSPAGAVANQFAGRVILFDANTTTAALRGQATVISASSNASNPTFTVGTLTTAPASGDTFSVI